MSSGLKRLRLATHNRKNPSNCSTCHWQVKERSKEERTGSNVAALSPTVAVTTSTINKLTHLSSGTSSSTAASGGAGVVSRLSRTHAALPTARNGKVGKPISSWAVPGGALSVSIASAVIPPAESITVGAGKGFEQDALEDAEE